MWGGEGGAQGTGSAQDKTLNPQPSAPAVAQLAMACTRGNAHAAILPPHRAGG